jgi:F5/8 type C domain
VGAVLVSTPKSPTLRKYRLARADFNKPITTLTEIDLRTCAKIYFSSEATDHPIDHILDGCSGRGATFWAGAWPNVTEEIVLEFDEPQRITHVAFEVEESHEERTQEVRADYSQDGGAHFQGLFVQEYTFSPRGSTFQCENLSVDLHQVTHLRLVIVPNKRGSGCASLTSLRLFA